MKRSLLAVGAVLLMVSASAITYLVTRPDERGTKDVALYVTDLPGGLEGLRVSILAATVGDHEIPLKVEHELVELSRLHGPNESLLVASGQVPLDAGERISLVFGGAEGFREGAWFPVIVPQNRLTLQSGVVNGTKDAAVLFDFNLDASLLVQDDGDVFFQPYVETAYQFQSTSNHEENSENTFNFEDVTDISWSLRSTPRSPSRSTSRPNISIP